MILTIFSSDISLFLISPLKGFKAHTRETLKYSVLDDVLKEAGSHTDIILRANEKPAYKTGETIERGSEEIPETLLKGWLVSLISEERWADFLEAKSADLAYTLSDERRYRVNIYYSRGKIAAVFRFLEEKTAQTFEELGLPEPACLQLISKKSGLILVTGAASQGKTTTLAAMVAAINELRSTHIITIEEPIEYVFQDRFSVISQREVGRDTPSFAQGLKDALREAPEVIVVGELRSAEEAETCLFAAETGHLVLATMHASSSIQALQKFLDWFPDRQQYMLKILTTSLQGIIYQRLLRARSGRHLAYEILKATEPMRQLLSRGDFSMISAEVSKNHEGNITFNQSLVKLVSKGLISKAQAALVSPNPQEFNRLLSAAS